MAAHQPERGHQGRVRLSAPARSQDVEQAVSGAVLLPETVGRPGRLQVGFVRQQQLPVQMLRVQRQGVELRQGRQQAPLAPKVGRRGAAHPGSALQREPGVGGHRHQAGATCGGLLGPQVGDRAAASGRDPHDLADPSRQHQGGPGVEMLAPADQLVEPGPGLDPTGDRGREVRHPRVRLRGDHLGNRGAGQLRHAQAAQPRPLQPLGDRRQRMSLRAHPEHQAPGAGPQKMPQARGRTAVVALDEEHIERAALHEPARRRVVEPHRPVARSVHRRPDRHGELGERLAHRHGGPCPAAAAAPVAGPCPAAAPVAGPCPAAAAAPVAVTGTG